MNYNYNDYLKMAKKITNEYPEDLLHDVLIKLKDDPRISEPSFFYVCLRNQYYDIKKLNYNFLTFTDEHTDNQIVEYDYDGMLDKEKRIKSIFFLFKDLTLTEKKIFVLYFKEKVSARKIGDMFNLSHVTIYNKIKKIKKLWQQKEKL